VRLVAADGRSADDLIVELAATLAPDIAEVATSDRGLRARLADSNVSFVGGGALVRDLLRHR
jgi:rRNA-processing protein FCF1